MIDNPSEAIASFMSAGEAAQLLPPDLDIRHEVQLAPHRPPRSLPTGFAAVYVFSLSEEYGLTCQAGSHRTLKVGMVGPKSAARFTSQHYLPRSSMSNLAKSLTSERILWPYLGITDLDEGNVKNWMLANLDRDHFFVPASEVRTERQLERFLRGQLGPVFEG